MADDRSIHVRDNTTGFTVLFPPFPAVGTAPVLGPHDPARARAVAAALSSVTEVVEEVDDNVNGYVREPADLDLVAVGHWGSVIQVWDPGLVTFEIGQWLDHEVTLWRARHPEARVVGSIFLDMVSDFTHDVVAVPGAETLTVSGWDEMEVTGDPHEVVRVLGLDPAAAFSEYVDLDAPDNDLMDELSQLLCVPEAWDTPGLTAFRVRRGSGHRSSMDDIWLGTGL
ncbi:MAG TPA: DUF6333 family protein [Actinocatenispora sp.]